MVGAGTCAPNPEKASEIYLNNGGRLKMKKRICGAK